MTDIAKVLINNVWQLLFMPLKAEIEQLTQKCFQQRVNLAGLIMEEHFQCVCHTRWQKRSHGQYDFSSPGFSLNLM